MDVIAGEGSSPTIARDAPPYDQWLRAREGTGTAKVVAAVRERLTDVRTRPDAKGSYLPKAKRQRQRRRNRKPEDQRTFEAVTDALVCNLVLCHLASVGGAAGWFRIPLSHQRLGGRNRYRGRAMARLLRPIAIAMSEAGLAELHYGGEGKPYHPRREQTRMRPADRMLDIIVVASGGVNFSDLTRDVAEELIILKDSRRPLWPHHLTSARAGTEPIDYAETPDTVRMRQEMRQLNAWWAGADLAFAAVDQAESAPIVAVAMRRIFNNRSFEHGGRLYGGFWQQTSARSGTGLGPGKPWRGGIRIEGEAVAVVDFNAMFLRLLYSEARVQAPPGDLYANIRGMTADDGTGYRDGVKLLTNALLFRSGGDASSLADVPLLPPPKQVPRGSREKPGLLPKGVKMVTMVRAICERHAPVAHLFGGGTGTGFRLFRRESDILLRVLHRCRAEGIIALPIHDAVIVKASRAGDAKRIMLECYQDATGFTGEVGEPKYLPGARPVSPEHLLDDAGGDAEGDGDGEGEGGLDWR